MLNLILVIFITWRLTTLITREYGPYEIFEKNRTWWTKKNYEWIEMRCFACMSVWVALPVAIFYADGLLYTLGLWLAGSAGAILLENINGKLEE
jgi:hypothetical protein